MLTIVTIEDPIEYLYRHRAASICQRELGSDTTSFAVALRAALRQSPKVIVVGEMRDHDTAEIALEAAETGHLVFSTLHTIDAPKAIDRLIGLFPQSEEQSLRNRFAQTFRYIISQRLIPKKGGGRVAAVEILKSTPRTREYIVKGEAENRSLIDAINDGYLEGMQSFDKDLERMVHGGVIEKDVALRYATNSNNLALALQTLPTDERLSVIWDDLVTKVELTASDILRAPDAIQQVVKNVDHQEIDKVVRKIMHALSVGDAHQKMAVLNVLPTLTEQLSPLERWKDLAGSVSQLISRCIQNENDEQVIYAYLSYFQGAFTMNYNGKRFVQAQQCVLTANTLLDADEHLKRHWFTGLEIHRAAFVEEIKNGSEGAEPAFEYIRSCGEKGAHLLFDWLAEEHDRATRIRLLNYFERIDSRYLALQIEKRLTDYRWYVVRNMITIMTKVNLPETTEFLQHVVNHEDVRVPKEILRRLYQSSSSADGATIDVLLRHPDKTVRIQATHLVPIVRLESSVPLLLKYASGDSAADTDLRAAALQSLSKMRAAQAIPLANKVLERKSGSKLEIHERNAAIKVLGELGGTSYQGLLKKIALSDSNPETREAASAYLR